MRGMERSVKQSNLQQTKGMFAYFINLAWATLVGGPVNYKKFIHDWWNGVYNFIQLDIHKLAIK